MREAFGDDCFPWAYWASQDSIAEHCRTGYYLTERQWLNRVMSLRTRWAMQATSTAGGTTHSIIASTLERLQRITKR